MVVTFDSLRNLTERYVTDKPLHNVLVNKLDAAKKVDAAGNANGKAQLLASYVQQIEKNTGRLIDADRGAVLIRLARAV